jgi:predicted 2-oxoglutarate/Fe(II)-dependent dioxygenase YbiX
MSIMPNNPANTHVFDGGYGDCSAKAAPVISSHFNVAVAGCEEPRFLIYCDGDFCRAHPNPGEPGRPWIVRRRRISIVIFLNDNTHSRSRDGQDSASSEGRALRFSFFHERPGQTVEQPAWDVIPGRGLLVAFPSATWHEVTPVTAGERFNIASCLLASWVIRHVPRPATFMITPRNFLLGK